MGAVYHIGFFRHINPLATGFGVAFLIQACLFAFWALRQPPESFRPTHSRRAWMGGLLLAYALLVYPQLATSFGHLYPARPTFGLPCPTTIATLGLLLWARPVAPWWIWIVPIGWSLIGTTAAFSLGIREDLGLFAAVLVVLASLSTGRRTGSAHVNGRRHR